MSSVVTGKSRNNIKELDTISSELYENIFKVNIATNADKPFYFYNILNKVVFPDNLKPNLFDKQNVLLDTPWTTLSYNLYGTISLWWVIYLLNNPTYIFLAKGGTQIKYIKPEYIEAVLNRLR